MNLDEPKKRFCTECKIKINPPILFGFGGDACVEFEDGIVCQRCYIKHIRSQK